MKILLMIALLFVIISCSHSSKVHKYTWKKNELSRIPSSSNNDYVNMGYSEYVEKVVAPLITEVCTQVTQVGGCQNAGLIKGEEIFQIKIGAKEEMGALLDFAEEKIRTIRSIAHEMSFRKWVALNNDTKHFVPVTVEFSIDL